MGKRRTKRLKQKNTGRISGARIWPAFLLLGVLGAMMIALIHAGAPGGELNERGLRVSGEGRSDASHVVAPDHFKHARVKAAYATAQRIPETMNQLYCWCGCIERGMRSALECFESEHGAECEICLRTAEIADEMTEHGITDARRIQREIDVRLGRV